MNSKIQNKNINILKAIGVIFVIMGHTGSSFIEYLQLVFWK